MFPLEIINMVIAQMVGFRNPWDPPLAKQQGKLRFLKTIII